MSDFLRIYLGLMGSGKTTWAIRDMGPGPRVIVYSTGSPEALRNIPYIYDSPEYLKTLPQYLRRYETQSFRIEKRASPSTMFEQLATLRGYRVMLDDLPALLSTPEDKASFQGFVRTIRYNGNQVVITAHRAMGDLPPLLRTVATSIYYVGPSHRGKIELRTLYEMVNYPIEEREFYNGLMNTKPYKTFPIRRA